MKNEKIIPIVKGAIKHFPGVKRLFSNRTGGTEEARYCYSVWMRHLINWNTHNKGVPETVAELGPGDSLGIGLAALLSGSVKIIALDVVKYWDATRNLKILEELIDLFRNKAHIPDEIEYPKVKPTIEDYSFPSEILSDELLYNSLKDERLNKIRSELINADSKENLFIQYIVPWNDPKVISPETIDFIYSQAVLEHAEDIEKTYFAMHKWLKPSGTMSHTIDFKSHGVTKSWNGHWTFSDFEWKIVQGGRPFLLNRQPYSKHIELHTTCGFDILIKKIVKTDNRLHKNQINKKYLDFPENDFTTSGCYLLSKKIPISVK